MLFKTDVPTDNAKKIQAQLKKELGVEQDIPYTVIKDEEYEPSQGGSLRGTGETEHGKN